jgi:hypothetical protein
MTNFMNLKIKVIYFFKDVYIDKMYIYIFISLNNHTYINIYIYTVFFEEKKITTPIAVTRWNKQSKCPGQETAAATWTGDSWRPDPVRRGGPRSIIHNRVGHAGAADKRQPRRRSRARASEGERTEGREEIGRRKQAEAAPTATTGS